MMDFTNRFAKQADCIKHLESIRYKDGIYCPHCMHTKIYKTQKKYRCANKACRKDFTVTVDTVFHNSQIPLQKWFIAIFLITTSKKGVSSVQLARQLGVTQKTAWFMDHRIRHAYNEDQAVFSGIVEVDEMFVGGKEKNKHASKKKGALPPKAAVVGIIHREQKQVIAKHVPNTKAITLKSYIYDNVAMGSVVMTDDNMGYRRMQHAYKHRAGKHGQGEYVKGECHTNSIESFWATFKRGYIGIYHYMSSKHLQKYVDEFMFRHNNKEISSAGLLHFTLENMNNRISYKELTSG